MRLVACALVLLTGCATIQRLPSAVAECASEQLKAATATALDDGARALASGDFVGEFDKFALGVGFDVAVCVLQKLARTMTGSRPQSGEITAGPNAQRDLIGRRAQFVLQRYRAVPR